MDANNLVVLKVRELLHQDISLSWNEGTNVLTMNSPVFRFCIVDWYEWNEYIKDSSYDEYAKHIATSFTESIILNEMQNQLLTLTDKTDRVEMEI